jgi:peptidoglycan/LPS O-acetylase OafA/YrhL
MAPPSEPPSQSIRPAPRYLFLDGLRGLAALFVVLHHAYREILPAGVIRLPFGLPNLLETGHQAVAIFIVLSGFCLGLPLARDPKRRLAGGFRGYVGRRARRILPPYYAALAFGLLVATLVPGMAQPRGDRWDDALPAQTPGVVASHLLLVHNLRRVWCYRIDPPMWSVATEWQIYLVFPVLLLVWRRFGLATTVLSALAVGHGIGLLAASRGWEGIRALSPWYLGLFSLGLAAAGAVGTAACSTGNKHWIVAALTCFGLAMAALRAWPERAEFSDPLLGAATASLLVACALGQSGTAALVRRVLETRTALALGAISYSLYLVHYPILAMVGRAFAESGSSARALAILAGAVPLSLVVATAFREAVERPFLPARLDRAEDRRAAAGARGQCQVQAQHAVPRSARRR